MRELIYTCNLVMAEKGKLQGNKVSTNTMDNTLKAHTKYSHTVRGRPTLKDVERFRNGSVHELYERSIYERTFTSEPFIETPATSKPSMSELIDNIPKLSNIDLKQPSMKAPSSIYT